MKVQISINRTEINTKPNKALIWEYLPEFLGDFKSKKQKVQICISRDEIDAMMDLAQVLDLSLLGEYHSLDSLIIERGRDEKR